MARLAVLISLFLFLGLSLTPSFAQENMTITTYYPSPYGSYKDLTAHSMKIGENYSLSSVPLNPNNLIVEGAVGIGIQAPPRPLHVFAQSPSSMHTAAFVNMNDPGDSSDNYGIALGAMPGTPYGSIQSAIFENNGGAFVGHDWYLILNPLGGNVGVGNLTWPSAKLQVETDSRDPWVPQTQLYAISARHSVAPNTANQRRPAAVFGNTTDGEVEGALGMMIAGPTNVGVTGRVTVDNVNKYNYAGAFWGRSIFMPGADGETRVGIGTATPSSILEINSNTSPFLPPRMDTSDRDSMLSSSSPPARRAQWDGAVIYNNDSHRLETWDASLNIWSVAVSGGLQGVRSAFCPNTGAIPNTCVFDRPFRTGTTPVVVIARNYWGEDEEMPTVWNVNNTEFKIKGNACDWSNVCNNVSTCMDTPISHSRGFYYIAIGEEP